MELRVLFVGMGNMGKKHLRALQNLDLPNIAPIAYVDYLEDPDINLKHYPDLQDALESEDANCAIISTPIETHSNIANICMDYGLHALVEKPIAEDFEISKRLFTKASENKLCLHVGHIEQYKNAFIKLKEEFNSIGTVLKIEATRYTSNNSNIGSYDPLRDLAVHDVELILSLFPASSKAEIQKYHTSNAYPNDELDLAFDLKGIPCTIQCCRRKTENKRILRIEGALGTLICDFGVNKVYHMKNSITRLISTQHEDALEAQLKHFFKHIQSGKQDLDHKNSILRTMEFIDQVFSLSETF